MDTLARTTMLVGILAAFAVDEPPPDARPDILDIAKDIEAGKDVKEKVAAFKKKYEDLASAMRVYKPRAKGGLGYGEPGTADGIEKKLQDLAREALTAARLTKEKAGLIKMGYVNIALGRITHTYAPGRAHKGHHPRQWRWHADDLQKAATDLLEAAKKGDARALQAAAAFINKECIGCHRDFRD